MSYLHKKIIQAFTLSEVLITLVVIGVVAAITIPIMVADWQKQATVAGLKKAYSTLSNAYTRSIADNGPVDTWEAGTSQDDILRFIFAPYLNVALDCKNNSAQNESCNYSFRRNRGNGESSFVSNPPLILADGTVVAADWASFVHYPDGTVLMPCFSILIDINGYKKPNRLGRDIFFVFIDGVLENNPKLTMKNVMSYPLLTTRSEKISECSQQGRSCGELIMEDGWQIKSDYPW